MDIFTLFTIGLNFLSGLAVMLVGLFMWRKLKDDFEPRTIGGFLVILSTVFFMMVLRIILWGLGLISESTSFNMFFVQYILVLSFVLPFLLPRLLYLVFNSQIAKKIGLILGIGFYLIYLVIHFSEKEKIIAHPGPPALLFELPYLEKIFFGSVALLLTPLLTQRVVVHFLEWRKRKVFPYKLIYYLILVVIVFAGLFAIIPFQSWLMLLGFIFIIAGTLGLYLISSQELMKREEGVPSLEEEKREGLKDRAEEMERLHKLTKEMQSKMAKLAKEIERLKKEK